MSILELALKSKVPFIGVRSDDLLYVEEVLSFIAGEAVGMMPSSACEADGSLPEENVLFTSEQVESKELYFKLAAAGKTLVFVNPAKWSVMYFNGGSLLPPRPLLDKVLMKIFTDKDKVAELAPCLGGLTLKDVRELVQLSAEKFGKVTSQTLNEIRQDYVSKLKGVAQVDCDQAFYDKPKNLSDWMEKNLFFFKNDIDPALRPRGILLSGPPGTGKTEAAKSIATSLGMPLFRLDIGGMKGKYVGDSEGNLSAALQSLDQMEPCVAIFDEIEKMFGEHHDGGTTSSMLGNLLWWLQEHRTKVLVVMTTNNVSVIPKELYRDGRIDVVLEMQGLNSTTAVEQFVDMAVASVGNKLSVKGIDEVREEVKTTMKTKKLPIAQSSVVAAVKDAFKVQYMKEMPK